MTARNDLYRQQITSLRRRFRSMKSAGIVFLCVGGVFSFVSLILTGFLAATLDPLATTNTGLVNVMISGLWSYISFFELIVGIVLLILAYTVVRHKIHNREVRLLSASEPEKN